MEKNFACAKEISELFSKIFKDFLEKILFQWGGNMSTYRAFIFAAVFFILPSIATAAAQEKESVHDRVLNSSVLRCAYFIVPPEFNKDPNTGKLSGIGYEVTEAAAKTLGLTVEWVEEVGFSEMTAGLNTGRYDAVCSSVFSLSAFAREADFTIPFMYTPVGIFVRANDNRFDTERAKINDPTVIIATIDGETAEQIAKTNFPKAKTFSMTQHTNVAMMLENVATGKADVAFTYKANFLRYDKNNPRKLKAIHTDTPIRAFGNTIMIPKGESELKAMLNSALSEIINSGQVNEIIAKNEDFPGAYYRLPKPYEVFQ